MGGRGGGRDGRWDGRREGEAIRGGREGRRGGGRKLRRDGVWKAKDQGIRNPVVRLIRMQLTIKKKKLKKTKPRLYKFTVSFSAEADNVKTH